MPSWLVTVLPYVGPALVALLTTMFSASVLTGRRLRGSIANDLAIVTDLNDGNARRALATEVEQRVVRLASLSRYPVLIGSDGFRILILVAISAFAVFALYDEAKKDTPVSVAEVVSGGMFLIAASVWNWVVLHASWSRRARARDQFLVDNEVSQDPRHVALVRSVGRGASMLLGFLAIGIASFFVLLPLVQEWVPDGGVSPVLGIATVAVFFLVMFLAAKIEYQDLKIPSSLNALMFPPPREDMVEKAAAVKHEKERFRAEYKRRDLKWWNIRERRDVRARMAGQEPSDATEPVLPD